ncbi:major facilitator superfamily domain-containing protein [Xylogone sp. PMI_703]|nr:major facilitator superfamily domain-containing protein [Xylogone sp. PMI_703]
MAHRGYDIDVDATLPPGTVHLVEIERDDLILVPKPSADPEDPLNWSRRRKWLNVGLVLFYVFSTGIGGASVYSVLEPISHDTGITLGQLVNGTGFLFLMAGWSNVIWQPLALTFGRRPVYLLSLIGCVAISEWTAWVDSYSPWAAARCLYGLMVGPVEVLPEICIPDIFFAHERGAYIAWYMLVLCGSNFIAPLIAGFMNDAYSWQWVQHWAALILALNLVLAFFFYEESMYTRDSVEAEGIDEVVDSEHLDVESKKAIGDLPDTMTSTATGTVYTRKTFLQKMKLFSYSGATPLQVLTMAYRPILIFFQFPNVMWASIMYGSSLAWYNVYNATTSSILASPPYSFSASMVGVTYVAPLIGTVIAGVVTGPLADWSTLQLARRSNGLREPEQRLWGLAIYCILMPAGLLIWGLGAAHQLHWAVLLFGAILLGYCNVAGGSYAIAYNVDCFREFAGESIVSMILCRNTMSFAFNYAITPWIDAQGLQKTFIAVAVLSFGLGCSFLLMTWKGKDLRRRSAKRYWKYVATQVIKHQ